MLLSFIAIPGAGKSTQISLLMNCPKIQNVISISVPSLYNRRECDIASYLTPDEIKEIQRVKKESDAFREKGYLAPFVLDDILFRLAYRLSSLGKIVIIDGAPRGLSQAKLFLDTIPELDLRTYRVIELYFDNDEERQSKERQYTRTIQNKKLTLDAAIQKITKIPNKI